MGLQGPPLSGAWALRPLQVRILPRPSGGNRWPQQGSRSTGVAGGCPAS